MLYATQERMVVFNPLNKEELILYKGDLNTQETAPSNTGTYPTLPPPDDIGQDIEWGYKEELETPCSEPHDISEDMGSREHINEMTVPPILLPEELLVCTYSGCKAHETHEIFASRGALK